ncbi:MULTISPECIES: hypothetical protein [unclassified Xanthobacter]|uniref:hypothetical protein n=1 Tax=unclassified Xanthobacter TaxID=2623496 RepID=UPI001F23EF97|nr:MULTISPECIES: hypothetical protein [unclassified Xanthobacter]
MTQPDMREADLPAIAVEALRARLESAVSDLPDSPAALVSSPWRAPEYGLFVHLHGLAPAASPLAPRPLAAGQGTRGAGQWQLRLLIGAFAPEDTAIHRLMARAAMTLSAEPLFDAASLAKAAHRLSCDEGITAGRICEAHREDLSLDDMTRLWRRFAPMRYSLSAAWRLDLA